MNGEASTSTRILFVDDSKVMLKTAFKILSAEFDTVTAVDGDDAWAKLEHDHDIQVLFTDINMPGTDGYGLLKKVRTADEPGLRGMPVILVTGADDDESAREKALEQGATDFLNKKFVGTELLPRARAHANYQRISRQLQEQSRLDPLTGLANEAGFLARLEQDIAYARRHGQELALLCVALDERLAAFQDRGSEWIDPILVQVANLIGRRIRGEDTAARIGPLGFAIALPGGHLDGIEAMAAWLHDQAANALEVGGRRISVELRTAAISAGQDVWISARDALDRCQALLDRVSEPVPTPAAPVEAKVPEPARPSVVAVPEPTATKAPALSEPVPRAPVREAPKVSVDAKNPEPASNALQRLMSLSRSFASRLGAFLKRIFGRPRSG